MIPDHLYRIIGPFGSRKRNALFNLMSQEIDIDEIYLYATDPNKEKYRLLYNKRENLVLKCFNDSKTYIDYLNDMNGIYANIERCNPNKKRKLLTVFDDMSADILFNKILRPIITESFIRGRKLNIPLIFIRQCYFSVAKIITLNSMHYFIMEIPNKQKLQQLASSHLPGIEFKNFINFTRNAQQKDVLF